MDRLLDPYIREILFAYMESTGEKLRILEEKNLGASRADLLMVTDGCLTGFEIKSDGDSYARLKTQVKDYDKYCDFCYLAVGRSHQKGAAAHLPAHWGILAVDREGVEELRPAAANPGVKLRKKLELLWKREMHGILRKNGMPKYKDKSRKFILDKLEAAIPAEELPYWITGELFERDYTLLDTK